MNHNQKNKVLIIDGNNALYRAYYKFSSMRSISGTPTGITYGFIYILKGLLTKFRPDSLYVVFDGGRAPQRLAILPNYKQREKKEEWDADDFYRQRDVTLEMLKALGVKVIQHKKTEADDIIWLLIKRIKRHSKITLVSSDKDFNQCLSKDVNIWNPSKLCLVTEDNVKNLFGYSAKHCVDYLILDGDNSDNIPGLKGVGVKTALAFLNEFNSIEEYLSNDNNQFKKWDKSKLEEVYYRNRELIDLKLFVRKYLKNLVLEIQNLEVTKIDEKELRLICADNSIKTFVQPPFLKEFKRLL